MIVPERGYWVFGDEATTLTLSLVDRGAVTPLLPGWNLIGYAPKDATPWMKIEDYLATTENAWTTLIGYDNPTATWPVAVREGELDLKRLEELGIDPQDAEKPLELVEEGKAYWLYVEEKATLEP